MAEAAVGDARSRGVRGASAARATLVPGLTVGYLSLVVLIPLAAVLARSLQEGLAPFWQAVTNPQAVAALQLTLLAAFAVVLVNAVTGTLIAWVLVRDDFWGRRVVNSLIDLPFALPTIVAGLVLLALYGPSSPVGIDIAYTRAAVVLALLFVTLPFVVRAVQPVLEELDRDMEEAAASLGAGRFTTFRRVVLPNLLPAIASGGALSFARAVGEFGAVALISGNLPNETEVASVFIFGQVELGNLTGASAVSVVLLVVSLLTLAVIDLLSRRGPT